MKCLSKHRYLEVIFNKLGTCEEEIIRKINLGKNIISTEDLMFLVRHIRLAAKETLFVLNPKNHVTIGGMRIHKGKTKYFNSTQQLLSQKLVIFQIKQNKEASNKKQDQSRENNVGRYREETINMVLPLSFQTILLCLLV